MKKIIVVGAGLAGSCVARLLAEKNYIVHVYEKRKHLGGHVYDFKDENGVLIHKYGPHIFHTNNDEVWNFVNRFSKFNGYINQVLVQIGDKQVKLPINLESIKELFPDDFNFFMNEIKEIFPNDRFVTINDLLTNLKSNKNKEIINFIYENVYVNYSSKMWGVNIREIDKSTLSRVKVNLTYDWNYFLKDKYQGLPTNGYNHFINNMLNHENIKIKIDCDALNFIDIKENKLLFDNEECIIFYTGAVDELFNFEYGELPYRSLNIVFESYDIDSYQEAAVINYPEHKNMTRICEYKKMTKQNIKNKTTISKEYPGQYNKNDPIFNTAFYPIISDKSNLIYNKYLSLAKQYKNLYLVGRLAQYKYFDMDQIILECIKLIKESNL